MKKIFIIIFILFSIFIIKNDSVTLELPDQFSGIKIPKPRAEIEKFDIDSISLRDITFLFDVAITNPYPVKLKFSTVRAAFFIENKQFFKTETGRLKIKAGGTETTRLFVNIKYADMAGIVKDYADKDSLECVIDMVVILPLPESVHGVAKDITFKFQLKKNVPTLKPEINIANFVVVKPSRGEIEAALRRSAAKNVNADSVQKMFGAIIDGKNPVKVIDPSELDLKLKVSFDILMKNKTKAGLYFNDLNYDFNINANKFVNGYTKDIKNKQNEHTLSVNNEFTSKAFGKAILKAFRDGKGEYSLTGFSMVKFPDKIKKEALKLNFNENGILNIK